MSFTNTGLMISVEKNTAGVIVNVGPIDNRGVSGIDSPSSSRVHSTTASTGVMMVSGVTEEHVSVTVSPDNRYLNGDCNMKAKLGIGTIIREKTWIHRYMNILEEIRKVVKQCKWQTTQHNNT